MFITTKFGENFDEKLISASFKMFWTGKSKSKSLTKCPDFYPDPPKMKKEIIFITTKFGENFEEQIDICFF